MWTENWTSRVFGSLVYESGCGECEPSVRHLIPTGKRALKHGQGTILSKLIELAVDVYGLDYLANARFPGQHASR